MIYDVWCMIYGIWYVLVYDHDDDDDDDENKPVWPTWVVGILSGVRDIETSK
jgi:hypothetical protein